MKLIKRSITAVALAAVGLTGCLGGVKKPEVVLSDIRVAGVGLRGASLIAELDIRNANDFDIETDSITYELFSSTPDNSGGWTRVLQRTYTQRITIDENRTTRVDVPIDFNYSDLEGAGRAILDRGTFNYRIQGNVFVREPLRRTMPFSKTGNVSLSGVR